MLLRSSAFKHLREEPPKRVMQARGNISFDEQNAITQYIMDESKIADELQDMKEELGESSIVLWALKTKETV